jgi:integrase
MKQAKHGWVKDQGREVHYPEGRFEIRRYENGKKIYTPIPETNPRDAVLALQKVVRAAAQAGDTRNSLAVIRKAKDAYIKDCERRGASEAAVQAGVVLKEFVPLCNVTYVKGITREMILDFHAKLRRRGLSERTIANKHERVKAFLKFCGVDTKFMPPVPKYEQKLPTIYTPDEIKAIRGVADDYMKLVIDLALKLGLREQELMFAEWSDIDDHHAAFRVQGKPGRGFSVKDSEQREITIPDDLLASLKAWHEKRPKSTLILGTKSDTPNTHLLRTLKRLAKKAGLSCGHCAGCKGKLAECREWSLHKFRRTCLTKLLRSGTADARTVQSIAGHSDLNTTLRYLKPASAAEMRSKMNLINWEE